MLDFQRFTGPHNVPIFFQPVPEHFKSVGLCWIVFAGSADDLQFGQPGLFHWFEHVPFRGTKRFPNGNADTLARFERWAGEVNAHTAEHRTVYEAHVLRRHWSEALDLLTDLVAQPLLREEDITAERQIIYEEITERNSNHPTWGLDQIEQRIWVGHPYGNEVIGTIETLEQMDPVLLRRAHAGAYDRSRCVLVVAGALSTAEVLHEASRCIEDLPDNSLSERRQDQRYGPLPSWKAGVEKIKAPFPASGTVMLFPQSAFEGLSRDRYTWTLLKELFSCGSTAPLFRIVREERQLVYDTVVVSEQTPDGGYWGFAAQTRKQNIWRVRAAYRDVLCDPQLRSPEWFAYIKDHLLAENEMRVRTPGSLVGGAEMQIAILGHTVSDDANNRMIASITHDEVMALLDSVTLDDAREFIFLGEQ